MQEVDSLEAKARYFAEEHRELVEDPETSSDVLGRVLAHGGEIIEALGSAYQAAVDEELPLAEPFRLGLLDRSLSPKELQERERPYKQAKKKSSALNDSLNRFIPFMEEVERRYHAKLDEENLDARLGDGV